MAPSKILVTGGSGFLGSYVCQYFLSKGYHVSTIDLLPPDPTFTPKKVPSVQATICDREVLVKIMTGADFVVHCAAALPLWKKDKIIESNVRGTQTVLDVAYELGIKRVVHISSTAVYGIPDHAPLLEEDALHGVGWYGKTKIASEKICAVYRKKGLCVPVLRPATFVGPGRLGVFAVLFDWVSRGKNIPLIGSGGNKYQLMDVDDLVHVIFLCLTKPISKVNDTFNVGSSDYHSMYEDFGALVHAAGFGKRILRTPAWLIIPGLRLLAFLRISPLYRWVYECAVRDCYVSTRKIEKLLGWKPSFSNQQSLIRAYQWYVKNKSTLIHATGVTHRVPWNQGILRFFRKFF